MRTPGAAARVPHVLLDPLRPAFATLAAGRVLLLALVLSTHADAAKRPRADLSIATLKVPASVVAGGTIEASDTTANGRSAVRATTTTFLLSRDARRSRGDVTLARRAVAKLKARKRSTGKTRLTIPANTSAGRWYVLACADGAAKVRERNEKNNCRAASPMTVAARAGGLPGPTPLPPAGPRPPATPPPAPSSGGSTPSKEPDPKPDPGTGGGGPTDPVDPGPSDPVGAPPLPKTTVTTIADATKFLYSGSDPLQVGVAPGTIKSKRVAVMRGRVLDEQGQPLSSVRVSILDHPELGSTLSRANGRFDLAVNGGEPMVVDYERVGYMSAQRTEEVPWQDFVDVPDVVMTRYEGKVTTVDEKASETQVVTGTNERDGDGDRTATLMFEPGTDAVMELPNGETKPLGDLEVRATEYTVGENGDEAMPGELPATSAYTYAVEFSVDEAVGAGATDVRFTKPVVTYVDNFLSFPNGTAVPAAYYDEEKAAWVPSNNGIVIDIVGEQDGLALVDATDDGKDEADTAAELAALGIDEEERRTLAERYDAPKSVWRVAVKHFTPWDYNWPYGCKANCDPPDEEPPPPPVCEECSGSGSTIGYFNQTLGEHLGVPGTKFALHYASDRAAGYKEASTLRIPLTGPTIRDDLQRVDLDVVVAGQQYDRSFAPGTNLQHEFTWNGKDAYGRAVQGAQMATVRVGYVYPAVYLEPEEFDASFGQFGGRPLSSDRTRREITVWQEWKRPIGQVAVGAEALGGWTLSAHHAYDPQARMIYYGDGDRQSTEALRSEIDTAVGSYGWYGWDDENEGARENLGHVRGIATGADGSVYFADPDRHVVKRVTPAGKVSTVAGGGTPDDELGDGLTATLAKLIAPSDVAVDKDGAVYISDTGNGRVRRVGTDGKIRTVAGGGEPDGLGDDGPATAATLDRPRGIAVTEDGTLYIADTGHDRVRRVTPDGRIATAAGGGTPADGLGDGGRAVDAKLDLPLDVEVDAQGTLVIADTLHHRVRAVRADGEIRTLAGNGEPGNRGDGKPAVDAQIGEPTGIGVSSEGTIFIADRLHHVVRRIVGDDTIQTYAGSGRAGDEGDGGPPAKAELSFPQDVTVSPDNAVYIADSGSQRIRRAAVALPGFTDAEIALPSEDGRQVFQFDATGRHLRTVDSLTSAVLHQFAYDSAGRLASVKDVDGNVTKIERDGSGKATAIEAPGGQRTALTINGAGLLEQAVAPGGRTTKLTYDGGGLLKTMTDPAGGVYKMDYDALGRLSRDESPGGYVQSLERQEKDGDLTVILETNGGQETVYRQERMPDGTKRTRVQSPSGVVQEQYVGADGTDVLVDADGTKLERTAAPDPRFGMTAPYDAKRVTTTRGGRTMTETAQRTVELANPRDPLSVKKATVKSTVDGEEHTSAWDAATRTQTLTTAGGRKVTEKVDAKGHLIATRAAPTAHEATYTYDDRGRIDVIKRGDEMVDATWDDQNRMVATVNAEGEQTKLEYDETDRVTAFITPEKRRYEFAYTPLGEMSKIRMPNGAEHVIQYTKDGYQRGQVLPGGATSTLTRDDANSPTKMELPGGRTIATAYDDKFRRKAIESADGKVSMGYTAENRLADLTRSGAGAETQALHMAYDGSSLTSAKARAGDTTVGEFAYTYGTGMLPTASKLTSGDDVVDLAFTYDDDRLVTKRGRFTQTRGGPAGSVSKVSDDKLARTIGYDAYARVSSLAHTVATKPSYGATYTRDKAGRIATKAETTPAGTKTFTYTYDDDGQLTEVRRDGSVVESYSWDPNGNRKSAGGQAATYDAQDSMQQRGGVAYEWTADGMLAKRGGDTFRYSAVGELLEAKVRGKTITYAYDGFGRRVARTAGGATERYLYGDPENVFTVTAVRGADGKLTSLQYDEDERLTALERDGARYYVATDDQGTPRAVSDATGKIVKELTYDSFGVKSADSAPSFELPIGFAGGLEDRDTGLVRFGLRDYEPASGRWTARDPLYFAAGQPNLYSYVGNDPVNRLDPSGLAELDGSMQLRVTAIVNSLTQSGDLFWATNSVLSGNMGNNAGAIRNLGYALVNGVADLFGSKFWDANTADRKGGVSEQICAGIADIAADEINKRVKSGELKGIKRAYQIGRDKPIPHAATRVDFDNGQSIVLDYHQTLDINNPRVQSVADWKGNG